MIAKRDHNFFWGSFRFRIFFLLMIMGLLPLLAGSEMIKRSYRSSIIDQKLSELRYTCQTVAGQMSGNSLAEAVDDEMTRELNFLAEYCGGRLLLVDSSYRILFDTYGVTQNKYCILSRLLIHSAVVRMNIIHKRQSIWSWLCRFGQERCSQMVMIVLQECCFLARLVLGLPK